jgi:hypothetical protein
MGSAKATARTELTFEDGRGGKVLLTADGLERLLYAAFDAGMVRFMLDMPKSGKCVANKPVQDWAWIECSAKHAHPVQYDGETAVYIHVDVTKDAVNGGLKGEK